MPSCKCHSSVTQGGHWALTDSMEKTLQGPGTLSRVPSHTDQAVSPTPFQFLTLLWMKTTRWEIQSPQTDTKLS